MKHELVKIVIFDKNTEESKELKYLLSQESRYFTEEIDEVNNLEKLYEINNIAILIINLNDETKNVKIKELSHLAKKIIIIDKDNILKKSKLNKNIKVINDIQDNRVIAFTILYDYYIELKNEKEKLQSSYSSKKFEKTMNNFERDNNKTFIFDKIDEIVMENRYISSAGYEKLKVMLYFCVINKLEIDEEKNYNYFYNAIDRIFDEKEVIILNEIKSTISLIRKRKKTLKIQNYLEKIKGRQIVEQIILISKIIRKNIEKK